MHTHASGKDAARAAIYPQKLCRAILRGCRRQLYDDGILLVGHHGMLPHRRVQAEEANEARRRTMRLEVFFEDESIGGSCGEVCSGGGPEVDAARAAETEDLAAGSLFSVKTKSAAKQHKVYKNANTRFAFL